MSTGQQATRKNYLSYYQNKDRCGSQIRIKQSPSNNPLILESFFLQKIASPVAAHLYQSIDKCGGELAD